MLNYKDVKGLMSMVPTCAKEGADSWQMEDSVDYDEAARVVDQLIKDGTGCIFTNGTTGECATILWEEHRKFVGVVLEAAKKRVPVFNGSTALGTKDTVRKLRAIMDMGSNGTLLGVPMWQPPTQEMALAHYKMVSEAVPSAAIVIYANPRAFRFEFPPSFFREIHKQVPNVIASKNSEIATYLQLLDATDHSVTFFPGYSGYLPFALLSPEDTRACWCHSIQPYPVLALIDAVNRGDIARAKEIQKDITGRAIPRPANLPPPVRDNHGTFTLQSEKMTMNAAGYCKAGPIRPPYHAVPQAIKDAALDRGQNWKAIAEKYAPAKTAR